MSDPITQKIADNAVKYYREGQLSALDVLKNAIYRMHDQQISPPASWMEVCVFVARHQDAISSLHDELDMERLQSEQIEPPPDNVIPITGKTPEDKL